MHPGSPTSRSFRAPARSLRLASLAFLALALLPTRAAEPTPALKDVFKEFFPVGTAVNRSMMTGTAGFRRSADQNAADVALLKHHFNQITAENDMKWQLIHPREGADGYDFAPADALVAFGLANNMQLVGHTLVWHSQTPNWVFAGTNPPPATATNSTTTPVPAAAPATASPTPNANAAPQAAPGSAPAPAPAPATNQAPRRGPGPGFGGGFGRYNGPRASREELLQRMRDHIHTVVGRYKGKVKVWDVVNEALADGNGTNVLRNSLWLEIIGPDFIAKAFHYAHEADPEAILRYNDYGLENPAKRKRLNALIRELQAQKVPIHAIGSQAHVNVAMSFETMDQSLAEMAALGLPIHITELDVNTAQAGQRNTGADIANNAATTQGGQVADANAKLADAYAAIFRAFLKHKSSIRMVTFWGVNDAVSWRAQGTPLLFDGENQPKPAFHAVIAEAKTAASSK